MVFRTSYSRPRSIILDGKGLMSRCCVPQDTSLSVWRRQRGELTYTSLCYHKLAPPPSRLSSNAAISLLSAAACLWRPAASSASDQGQRDFASALTGSISAFWTRGVLQFWLQESISRCKQCHDRQSWPPLHGALHLLSRRSLLLLDAGDGAAPRHVSRQTACGLPVRPRKHVKAMSDDAGTADFLGLDDAENDPGLANRQSASNSDPVSRVAQAAAGADGQTVSVDDVNRSVSRGHCFTAQREVLSLCTASGQPLLQPAAASSHGHLWQCE